MLEETLRPVAQTPVTTPLPPPIDPKWSSPAIRFWQKNFPKDPLPLPKITPAQAREKWGSYLRDLLTDHDMAFKCAMTVELEAMVIHAIYTRKLGPAFDRHMTAEIEWFTPVSPSVKPPVALKDYFPAVMRRVKLGVRV